MLSTITLQAAIEHGFKEKTIAQLMFTCTISDNDHKMYLVNTENSDSQTYKVMASFICFQWLYILPQMGFFCL